MDIYIKPNKKLRVNRLGKIHLKDIAQISADKKIKSKIENLTIYTITNTANKSYLISVIDIVNAINKEFPGNTINNLGEMDTIIEYSRIIKTNQIVKYIKIIIICIILIAGSATAIMSFHSDAQMSTVFENYYYIFFNEKIENPAIINLPYSIGLSLGIIIFFNHFAGKKITSDPTPIEVEMSTYEKEVTDNIIDTLNKENGNDS